MAAHTSDPRAWEVVKGGPKGHHPLSGELQASLAYMRFCPKKNLSKVNEHPYLDREGQRVTEKLWLGRTEEHCLASHAQFVPRAP